MHELYKTQIVDEAYRKPVENAPEQQSLVRNLKKMHNLARSVDLQGCYFPLACERCQMEHTDVERTQHIKTVVVHIP